MLDQILQAEQLVDGFVAVVSLGLYGVCYAVARIATRPARVRPEPATPDLGEEPPAVVSLLANGWQLTEDAAESTLLDLAARRLIELRQLSDDPYQTTVHVSPHLDDQQLAALRPYERQVLERIRALAVGGVVPVTALTFRNADEAKRWNKRLRQEVVEEARARGLSRRRFGPTVVSALSAVAAVTGCGLAWVVARIELRSEDPDVLAIPSVGVTAFIMLAGFAARPMGERDTPAGRAVAARWLAVREWLRGHEEFAKLPPAAVMVWDRYLPYGAALGVTHTASAVLDLGLGDRRRLWSSYGGHWHRVRVRYPRLWARYGLTVPRLVMRAVVGLLIGYVFVRWHGQPADLAEELIFSSGAPDPLAMIDWALLAIGVGGLLYGGYVLSRAFLDLATTRVITGQVLWVEVWRSHPGNDDRPPRPWLDYLAVDDGSGDRTTAWGLPRKLGVSCRDGDTVRLRVRPWSRRVVELTVLERRHRPDPVAAEPSDR